MRLVVQHATENEQKAIQHQAEEMHLRLERIAPIFELVLQATDSFQFTRPLEFLHADADCRRPVRDAAKLTRRLASNFSREHLEEAGAIDRDQGESIVVHPSLISGDGPLLFLRNTEMKLFDIVTADGKCRTGACPLFAMVNDEQTRNLQSYDSSYVNRLMGVVNMSDVALLRAMGVAAVPLTYLERLPAPHLRRLIDLTGAKANSPTMNKPAHFETDLWEDHTTNCLGDEAFPRVELQIVSGVLSAPTSIEAERLCAVVDNLKLVSCHLDVSWECISVWWPTEVEREELACRLRLRTPELLQEFFHKERSVHPLDSIDSGKGPPSVPSAATALVNAMHEVVNTTPRIDDNPGDHDERQRKALDEFGHLIEKHFVQPQIAQAIRNSDPVAGQLEFKLAQTFQQSQQLAPVFHKQLGESIQQLLEGGKDMKCTEVERKYFRFLNAQLRISRELKR